VRGVVYTQTRNEAGGGMPITFQSYRGL